jgi:hypothetical protein
LGSVTTKFGGSTPPVRSSSRVRKQVEGPQAAPLELFVQRFDADADRRRQRPGAEARGHFVRGDLRVAVLLMIGPAAKPSSKSMRKSSTGSRASLSRTRAVDAIGRCGLGADGRRQGGGVRGVLVERPERHRPELLRRIGLEEVRAAVDRVYRLALGESPGNRSARRMLPLSSASRNAVIAFSGIVVSAMDRQV